VIAPHRAVFLPDLACISCSIMLRMHVEILFCRNKRKSERKTREGKGMNEGMHTRGNSEYGSKRMERLKKSESKREIRKEKKKRERRIK
jgi:hypothetical protein